MRNVESSFVYCFLLIGLCQVSYVRLIFAKDSGDCSRSLHPAAKARARLTLYSFYEDKIHTSANVGTPATNDH